MRNKRYTLAVRQLVAGDTTNDVLAEFLELADGLDLGVKAVYLDCGFYNRTCLGLLSTHNYAYVMMIVRWGETIQDELSRGWNREIENDPVLPCVHRLHLPTGTIRRTRGGASRLRR